MNCCVFGRVENQEYFTGFVNGDQVGFTYVYGQLDKKLLRHNLRIVADEFVVNSSIEEAWEFRKRLTQGLKLL